MMDDMIAVAVEFFFAYGVYGLFAMSFMESSFFPIPPDIVLIMLCVVSPAESFFYAGVCTVASVLGAVLGFAIGKYGGRAIVDRFFSKEKVLIAEEYYRKYDVLAIGIAGFTPIPYKIFTITSGLFQIDFVRFIVVSFFARGARFFIIGALFFFWGDQVKFIIESYFNIISIVFIILLGAGYYAVNCFVKRSSISTS